MRRNPKSKDWKSKKQFEEFYELLKSTIISCWDPLHIKDAQKNLSQVLSLYSLDTDMYCADCVPLNSYNKGIYYKLCNCEECQEGKDGCEQKYCVCLYDNVFLILEKVIELIRIEKIKLSHYFEKNNSYYETLFFFIAAFLITTEEKLISKEMIREWLNFYEKNINLITRILSSDINTINQLNDIYFKLEKEYHKNPRKKNVYEQNKTTRSSKRITRRYNI